MKLRVLPENLDKILIDNNMGTINHISEIINIVSYLKDKYILGAFDWDNCISLTDGCNLPLRDPKLEVNPRFFNPVKDNGDGKKVLETFNSLNDYNVNWFVLTARLGGDGSKEIIETTDFPRKFTQDDKVARVNKCVIDSVNDIWKILPFNNHKYQSGSRLFPLIPTEMRHLEIISGKRSEFTTFIYGGVIYSGSSTSDSNKGRALIKSIIFGILPDPDDFDYIIFVDNDDYNIKSVIDEFNKVGLRHKLIPIYYPQNPPVKRYSQDRYEVAGPCTSRFSFEKCFEK